MLLEFNFNPVGQLHLAVMAPCSSGTLKQIESNEHMLLASEQGVVNPAGMERTRLRQKW